MRLFLDRQIFLDQTHEGFAEVVTEARKWTKGWVAQLVDGDRRFCCHDEARLSRAGFGERRFTLLHEGNYEAESVCASLYKHRVRFDIAGGGIIRLRISGNARRCGHFRQLQLGKVDSEIAASPYTLLRSIVEPDEPREAAISLGGHLEQHLQRMCEDRGLTTHVGEKSKGIGQLSAILKNRSVFPKETHKSILRIAELRKIAQHEGESPDAGAVTDAVVAFFQIKKLYPVTS